MTMKKTLLTLGLGIAGGCVAFLGVNALQGDKEVSVSQWEIASPVSAKPAALAVGNQAPAAGAGSVDLRYAAKKTVPAVVHVKTVQMGQEYMSNPLLDFFYGTAPRTREVPQRMGSGSGVIVSEDGYIITNNHVIEDSDKITVALNNKKEYEATLVGTDPNTDIALLKIEETGLPYLEYANSDDVELGEWVLAVGNPYNLTSTVTAGIISAKARELGINRREMFAVPANIARKVVGDLKEFGMVQRAVIGIRMVEVTDEVVKKLGLDEIGGIYVVEAVEGGAAAKAGLKEGDVIKKINGIDVNTAPAFQGQLGKYHPGATVKITVKRDGKLKDFDVVLQNTYGDTSVVDGHTEGILGATVESLSREDRYRYGINKGVKITELKNGPFKALGLSEGTIIVKINNMVIYDKEDLVRALKMAENEGVLLTTISPKGRVEYFALSPQD